MDLGFRFGADRAGIDSSEDALTLNLTNEVLQGPAHELWKLVGYGDITQIGDTKQIGDFTVWGSNQQVCGIGCCAVNDANMNAASYALYEQLLKLSEGMHLHRIWNFLPGINESIRNLDQYMLFCQGRADAFGACRVRLSDQELPAASAVGTPGELLWVGFIAGPTPANTIENPLQTPAYEYPRRYGPSSPSFARGAVLQQGRQLLISGTASIRKSESLHIGNALAQAQLALDNIGLVVASANFGVNLSSVVDNIASARVYVRNPDVWRTIAPVLTQLFSQRMNVVNVVQAEICRAELLVEIEVHIRRSI